jgi:Domain of unknown function (DUF5615)
VTVPRLRGILLDNHIGEEFFHLIEREFVSGEWTAWWRDLDLDVLDLDALNLPEDSPDDIIWHTCQREGLVLLTGNRNRDGDDSLEATIRRHSQPHSLPVITISDVRRFGKDSAYDARLARSLLAYLLDIDMFCGTGRLYVPID